MTNSPPPGTKLCIDRLESTGEFVVEVAGAQETLFNGEHFQLLFKFTERYPFESPQVSLVCAQFSSYFRKGLPLKSGCIAFQCRLY